MMTIPDLERLPEDLLLELLPAAFEPWGSSGWYPSRPPTARSIRLIESTFRITLPPLFVEVARSCPSYGGWFNSIGNDYKSHNHILTRNASYHASGLPARYILFNHGHDGDCDAWDREGTPIAGELPIVYFRYDDETDAMSGLRPYATSFAAYIGHYVRSNAPRCPEVGLRRRAKRLLDDRGPLP